MQEKIPGTDFLFRDLDEAEAEVFRQYVRDNWKPGDAINPLWHPVSRAECHRLNKEAGIE